MCARVGTNRTTSIARNNLEVLQYKGTRNFRNEIDSLDMAKATKTFEKNQFKSDINIDGETFISERSL